MHTGSHCKWYKRCVTWVLSTFHELLSPIAHHTNQDSRTGGSEHFISSKTEPDCSMKQKDLQSTHLIGGLFEYGIV